MTGVSKDWIERRAKSLPEDDGWALSCWAADYFNGLQPADGASTWWHVPLAQMRVTDAFVAGNTIKPLAAQYIGFNPSLQDANTDWLVANTLCFAEVNATLVHFRMMNGGKQSTPLSLKAIIAAASIVGWIVWLAIVLGSLLISGWLTLALALFTLWGIVGKAQQSMKKRRLMAEMMRTYESLCSSTFSWSIFWDHLAESRKLGAVWPPELYKLTELRMRH
ncbi:hypothetical protein N7670_09840 [Stenotrophomonas maltophilia]|uniref:hypothetical protein n=1 Tax=Stenotrophomonas maltophilia TaxID=40324 RepID=UPI00244AFF6C|nr:hypothetical protein [Stenotrophomonas maltophilia]MDG9939668.1 hypothetical protein [Stenotrophomonas maltophilia]MDH0559513.1 hypothetical protein [Stenotrophomonas maltophilia]